MKDCTDPSQFSGDNGERDPPVPIPNTEVKPFSADGTWLETTWESRMLPDSMKKNPPLMGVGSFFISSATSLSQVVSNEVRECCGGAHSMSQRGVYGKDRDNAG